MLGVIKLIKDSLNSTIMTFSISCFLIFGIISPTEFVNTDFNSFHSIITSFSVISYLLFLGVFILAFPLSLLTNILLSKVQMKENIWAYKFIIYIMVALIFSVIYALPLYGMSFFSIIVAVLFFFIEVLISRLKPTYAKSIYIGSSYLMTIIIFVILATNVINN